MRTCVCVSAPGLLKTIHVKSVRMANQTSPTAFQFLCTARAINIVDGRDLSYEAHRLRRAR